MKGAKQFGKTLSPTQRALWHLLQHEYDVPIVKLYRKVYIDKAAPRHQQQCVGAIISRINRKLAPLGYRIGPGSARRTYCMTRLPK